VFDYFDADNLEEGAKKHDFIQTFVTHKHGAKLRLMLASKYALSPSKTSIHAQALI
jgi:hypothetical protein